MTGTRVEIELVTSNQEMKVNRPLAEVFYQAMEQTNLPEYTEEELRFAESLTKEAGLVNDGNYFGGLEPLEDQPVLLAIGTDVSEVSHTVPTVMLSAATMCKGTEVFYQAMEQTNLPEYTEEELRFAESLTKEAGLVNDGNYFGGLEPLEDQPVLLAIGTDVSEVSHTVPTVMLSAATMCKGTPLHHWSAAAQSGMSIGQKGMLYVTECMAKGALRLEGCAASDRRAGAFNRSMESASGITIFQKLHMVIREVVRCLQRYRPFRMPLQRSKEAQNFQKSGEWYIFSEFTMERSWQPISAICLTEMRFTDFIFMREPVREQKRNHLHRRTDTTIRQMPCTRSMREICLRFWQMTEMHF